MLMDDRTKKLLDIERVLAELHPITPFGQKCKNELKPYLPEQKQELIEELDRVELIHGLVNEQRGVFVEIRTSMRQVKDIRKSVERCMGGGVLNAVEFFELKNFVYVIKSMAASQKQMHWKIPDKFRIRELEWVETLLDPENTGIKTFYIYDHYSEKLKEIRQEKALVEKSLDRLRREITAGLEKELGIPIRPTGELIISKNQPELIKKLQLHDKFQIAGETFINITFRIRPTEEMQQQLKQIEFLKEEEFLEESHILESLSMKVAARAEEIIADMDAVGEFDLLVSKAYLANAHDAVKPVITDGQSLIITDGRHPIVEAGLRKKGREYTPISVALNTGVALITGANMGGKTVSVKMMGLLTVMVHYGLLVPARRMETGVFDFIFLSAGDEQSIDLGLSTFGAEMQGIRNVLAETDRRGLIMIDELARGTNPHEGFAISAAIINFLLKKPCITIITTHFDGLVRPGIKHLQVTGLRNIDCSTLSDPEAIARCMDYTLLEIEGETNVPRDAINISRMMGLPEEILREAEKILNE